MSALLAPLLPVLLAALLAIPARGQGFFADPVLNPFGTSFTPSGAMLIPVLADMDGDGDQDLFAHNRIFQSPCWQSLSFEYFENQGSDECPEFIKQSGQTFGLPGDLVASQFVDIDNDGDLDAFAFNHCAASTISYYENTGTRTEPAFSSAPTLAVYHPMWNVAFASMVFGDLDGDGDYDALLNGLRPSVFKYLENMGDAESFWFPGPVNDPFGLQVPPPNGSEWSVMADWDCDGDLDILNSHLLLSTGHEGWALYYHENVGSTTAPSFLPPVPTGDTVMVTALADLDGDGDLDLLSDEYYYENKAQNPGCVSQPVAVFDFAQQEELAVQFSNTSTAQATDCRPVSWFWDFGDGATSAEENPMHIYPQEASFQACLTVEDVAGSHTYCTEVEAVISSDQSQGLNNQFRIYPNPAFDVLTLEWEGREGFHEGRALIFDAYGKKLQEKGFRFLDKGSGISVDITGLPAGHYVIKVHDGSRFAAQEFVKTD